MAKVIDACGRSCPEPVILTKAALKSGEKNVEVLVDNGAAAQNVTRFAQSQGYTVTQKSEGELHRLLLSK